MSNPGWKQFERRVAKLFGTKRNPLSGGNGRHGRSDTLHPRLFLECKNHAATPGFSFFQKVMAEAKKEEKLPVLVQQPKNSKTVLVTCRLQDLAKVADELELKGPPPKGSEPPPPDPECRRTTPGT